MNCIIIGIDSSTTACKAIAWDKDGRAAGRGRASYELLQPAPQWCEQDAEHFPELAQPGTTINHVAAQAAEARR